jgi:DNA-binding transcriptional ArsR family regulator
MVSHKVEIRRRKVKRLLAQGAPPTEIAERLESSRQTVARDLDAIEEEVAALKQGDIDSLLRDLVVTFETVNTELWRVYHDADADQTKLKALRYLKQTKRSQADVLQQVGILDRATEEVRVTGADDARPTAMVVLRTRDE